MSKFESITTNKVVPYGYHAFFLVSFENFNNGEPPLSSVYKVYENEKDGFTYIDPIYKAKYTILDITVSSRGTVWAIDIMGYLHCSKPVLDNNNVDGFVDTHSLSGEWSFQNITKETPICVIGEDDDLWIATRQGSLLHFNGKSFVQSKGIENPIRFKEINNIYYLIGHNKQLIRLDGSYDNSWTYLSFDKSIPDSTVLNDITILNDKLVIVSSSGFILIQDKGVFVILHETRITWYGCDNFEGKVYLGGESGCYLLNETNFEKLQSKLPVFGVTTAHKKIFFNLSNTKHGEILKYIPQSNKGYFFTFVEDCYRN